ncbi:MAG: GxxExxY protein [Acetobacteraceae bacterium]|nr:GxxExxY protein [Acetobacteraceae bacterium]
MHAEHADSDRLNDFSGRVIGCAFTVFDTLGAGFLEKVYENALHMKCVSLAWRLRSNTVSVGTIMTWWSASISRTCWSRARCWLQLKTAKALDDAHRMQCTNCLKASGLRLNFGKPRLEIKRVVNGL